MEITGRKSAPYCVITQILNAARFPAVRFRAYSSFAPVVRNYSIKPTRTVTSTHDAARPAPIGRVRAHPPPIDVGILTSGLSRPPAAAPAHRFPVHYADARSYSTSQNIAGSLSNALRKAGSSNQLRHLPSQMVLWPSGLLRIKIADHLSALVIDVAFDHLSSPVAIVAAK